MAAKKKWAIKLSVGNWVSSCFARGSSRQILGERERGGLLKRMFKDIEAGGQGGNSSAAQRERGWKRIQPILGLEAWTSSLGSDKTQPGFWWFQSGTGAGRAQGRDKARAAPQAGASPAPLDRFGIWVQAFPLSVQNTWHFYHLTWILPNPPSSQPSSKAPSGNAAWWIYLPTSRSALPPSQTPGLGLEGKTIRWTSVPGLSSFQQQGHRAAPWYFNLGMLWSSQWLLILFAHVPFPACASVNIFRAHKTLIRNKIK